jgi:hypothetical protein
MVERAYALPHPLLVTALWSREKASNSVARCSCTAQRMKRTSALQLEPFEALTRVLLVPRLLQASLV